MSQHFKIGDLVIANQAHMERGMTRTGIPNMISKIVGISVSGTRLTVVLHDMSKIPPQSERRLRELRSALARGESYTWGRENFKLYNPYIEVNDNKVRFEEV